MAGNQMMLPLGIVLSLGIFLFDITNELGRVVPLFYILVVIVLSRLSNHYAPIIAGIITSVLTLGGWALSPHEGEFEKISFNRMISLLVIWGTVWWLVRNRAEEIRFQATLKSSENRLLLALESGQMKIWEWNMGTDTLVWEGNFFQPSDPAEPRKIMTLENFLAHVYPEDQTKLREAFSLLREGHNFQEIEFRILQSHGEARWIGIRSHFAVASKGKTEPVLGIYYDITGRKKKEALLQENQRLANERLAEIEGIYQNVPIGLCVLDSDLRYVRINHRLAEINGIPPSQHIGRTVREIVPALADSVEPTFRRILETGEPCLNQELTGETLAQPGRQRVWLEHWLPLKNLHDQVIGINVVVEEVTERIAAQKALQESELTSQRRFAELQALYNTTPIGLCFVDKELRFVKINTALAQINGLPVENHLGRTLREILPSIADRIEPHFQQVLATGQPVVDVEIPLITPAHPHTERWYLVRCHPVLSQVGSLYGVNVIVKDITDRKKAESALKESEARFRMMGDEAPVIIWLSNSVGRVEYLNRQWFEFTGISPEQDLDQARATCVHPEDRPSVEQSWRAAKDHYHSFRLHYRLRGQDGTYRWVVDSASPRMNSQHEFLGHIGSIIDVTDLKEAEEMVAKHNMTLEQKVRERTHHLIHQRDQLRKLTSDLTLTEQRERRRLANDLHDYLAQILVVCRMKIQQAFSTAQDQTLCPLLEQVNTLLEESLTYTRTLVAELCPRILYESGLPDALKWLALQMVQHGMTVNVKIEDGIPLIPEDQSVLLYQTVRELLFNIIKHASVDVAEVTVKKASDNMLEVIVIDHGKGFDLVEISPGFSHDKFGLMNIRERIEAMEGQFLMESCPGKGTRIVLRVPLQKETASEPDIEETSASPVAGTPWEKLSGLRSPCMTVLLVDDHAMVREGLKSILAGYENVQVVGEAADGQEAIDLAHLFHPNVIVMDVNMPYLNGVKATQYITKEFPSIKIIALSINEDDGTVSAMRQAGAVAYLNKGNAATHLHPAICAAYEEYFEIP